MATDQRQWKNATHVRAELVLRRQRSAEIQRAACEVLAREIPDSFETPHPTVIKSTEGCYVTDVDGNRYIDLVMGFGALVLGHRHTAIQKALHEQVERGFLFAMRNEMHTEVAQLVQKIVPCAERTLLCNTGSEATMYAIRVARAFTGRHKVALFDGCYHGNHDYVLARPDPKEPNGKSLFGPGVPDALKELTLMLPYHDEAAFSLIRKHASELALVLVQPVQNSTPSLDNRGFLEKLRDVCRESNVVLGFDEVVTGFRLALGGAQEFYDLVPDIATYGKTVAGGVSIGALCGRADIMSLYGGAWNTPKRVFQGGTFTGNPLSMAAAVASIRYLMENRNQVYPHLREQSERFASAVNAFCREKAMSVHLLNASSIMSIHFQDRPLRTARDIEAPNAVAEREFYLQLMYRGVMALKGMFISIAHSPQAVDTLITAFQDSLMAVREDGLI
ncbi:MAG TPA: aspartate aminotransferase family protein [Archangium sp.]|uniref:aspartate aminotransferase family protein n=1 Tax=Archangium sp. TaxID=1872627 RepID=UPI002E336322|nr:aspartate aminotransferase family protein [Archangium sp.]HEX5748107.1 aspartate aminotransferase family protein [Archangium sp.]